MIRIVCEENADFYAKIAEKTYEELKLKGNCILELIITDDEEIRNLNREFRDVDKSTDVLSFPLIDFSEDGEGISKVFNGKNYPFEYDAELKAVMLGSVVINTVRAVSQAEEYGHSLERELGYLFLHGMLHVLGYDHTSDDDKKRMRAVEEGILKQLELAVKAE